MFMDYEYFLKALRIFLKYRTLNENNSLKNYYKSNIPTYTQYSPNVILTMIYSSKKLVPKIAVERKV